MGKTSLTAGFKQVFGNSEGGGGGRKMLLKSFTVACGSACGSASD